MKKIILGMAVILSSYSSQVFSYTEVFVDGRSTPEVTLSNKAYNRISYKEGEVKSIIGSRKELEVNLSSGMAFLKPKEGFSGPLTVTVITSDDEAQDLSIKVADKPSEHVQLLDRKESVDLMLEKISTISFLNTILEGDCPDGFKMGYSSKYESIDLPIPLECNHLQTLEGPTETIEVYRIVNNSRKKEFELSASLFKNQSNLWVFLSKPKLEPKDSGLCVISIPKQEIFE